MLIKIPKIYMDRTKEMTIDIWINSDKIIKIEPLNFKNSIAKSHITIKDVEPWNSVKSTLTPDEIAGVVNVGLAELIIDEQKYISCPNCGANDFIICSGGAYDNTYLECKTCGAIYT